MEGPQRDLSKTEPQDYNDEHSTLLGVKPKASQLTLNARDSNAILHEYFRKGLFYFFIAVLIILVIYFLSAKSGVVVGKQDNQKFQVRTIKQRLPRIFWIYTQNQVDAEPMEKDIYIQYYAFKAKQLNYEIRYANSWNSYNWLTNQTTEIISKTMQNSKIDETIHSLLKIALLMENGGIMADSGNVFISQDFGWLEQMFDVFQGISQLKYGCKNEYSYLFMPKRNSTLFGIKYSTTLIAAIQNNSLLQSAFHSLKNLIQTGELQLNEELNLLQWNQNTRVSYLPSSLQNIINLAIYKHRKQQNQSSKDDCRFGIQYPLEQIELFLDEKEEIHLLKTVASQQGYSQIISHQKRKNVSQIMMMSGLDRRGVNLYLEWLIKGIISPDRLSNQSLLYQILSAPGNREVFLQPLPKRTVQLCIIVMESLAENEVKQTTKAFDNQTFDKWKLIIPAKDPTKTVNPNTDKIVIMSSQTNKLHNLQKAITKHCLPNGYAILLNKGQNFNTATALAQIAQKVQPRDIVGLFISLSLNGCVTSPKKRWTIFDREFSGIIDPKVNRIKRFLNHFRIFSIETFRMLPQFAFRDMYGQYFEDRSIFLMDLLDQPKEQVTQPNELFLIKKYAHLWNMPLRVELVPRQVNIGIKEWQEVSLEQLKKTRTRLPSLSARQQLNSQQGIRFVSIDAKKGPQLIPRIIHQVWLGTSDLPPAKQYFFQKTQKIYPNYTIKLWRQHDLTKQNFPMTYDVIQTLIKFNKNSPYNKLASVTDIMRHEIMYHQGGFWKDAGMNFLRPIFDKFLKYQLVLPVDRIFKYRFLQGMCFFGNMPKYDKLMRINSFKNINRMRIYQTNPLSIAGPVDFRQLLVGQEEYDPDILILAYETFYPGQVGQHPENDLCTKRKKKMRRGQKWQIKQNGWYLLSQCPNLYPYAFGIQHNRFGSTWQKRRS